MRSNFLFRKKKSTKKLIEGPVHSPAFSPIILMRDALLFVLALSLFRFGYVANFQHFYLLPTNRCESPQMHIQLNAGVHKPTVYLDAGMHAHAGTRPAANTLARPTGCTQLPTRWTCLLYFSSRFGTHNETKHSSGKPRDAMTPRLSIQTRAGTCMRI